MYGPGMPGPQLYNRRLLAFTLRAAHVRPLQPQHSKFFYLT